MDSDCNCPVCVADPPTYPLGVPFADKLRIEPIRRQTAAHIYREHHEYMPDTPTQNIVHHGILLNEKLAGAITWRHPLMSSFDGTNAGYICEAARVCIAVDMPNLASAAFARSEERFLRNNQLQRNLKMLLFYVKDDGYDGTMLKAVSDRGWKFDGMSEGGQPGNREAKDIHGELKQRWVKQLTTDAKQTSLATYG